MFMRMGKLALVAGLGFGLSACASLYDNGQKASTSGGAFETALLGHYQSLAKMEATEADWLDADFFSQRALLTAAGTPPEPQALAERDLVEPHLGELTAARNMLTTQLEDGAAQSKPDAAAMAQAGFDCWMQEAEENIQPDDIKACKDMYWAGMNVLQAEAPVAAPAPTPTGPWVVLFNFDKSDITYDGQLEINKAVAAATKLAGSNVLLSAHTDTAGSEQYNLGLSARRAKAVIEAMGLIGVSSDRVTASAVGESDPAVATGDGVRNQANRRVEIRIAN